MQFRAIIIAALATLAAASPSQLQTRAGCTDVNLELHPGGCSYLGSGGYYTCGQVDAFLLCCPDSVAVRRGLSFIL
ncbi:hypothetical protein PENSPDRAFT_659971 [Peniophora sp. CONT]|nr:hypothetical protein PENSPDRAFT_659971 [Peniophora sp. CONT]